MNKAMLNYLVCPQCKNKELKITESRQQDDEIIEGNIVCVKCKREYPIIDTFPVFLDFKLTDKSGEEVNKKAQIEYFNEGCDEEYEIHRPHNAGKLYKYLMNKKFENVFKYLPYKIEGQTLLDACCGSGMASEYYARNGAKVIASDISLEAVKRAKLRSIKYGFKAEFVVADVEYLPFKSNYFDMVSVHDGLHHLRQPYKGITELSRVTKDVFFITEPAKALFTSISVILNISQNYEEAGNFVYRFREKELKELLLRLSFCEYRCRRYLMYYPHVPPKWFKYFENRIMLGIFIAAFYMVNVMLGYFGNKMFFVTWNKSGINKANDA